MSQVFAADTANAAGTVSVPTTTETTLVVGRFLNPPFGTARVMVNATFYMGIGTGATSLGIRLYRNPNGENLKIAEWLGINVTAGNNQPFTIQIGDSIPDGRPVQYQVTVQQAGATANGSVPNANITTLLISG